LLAIVDRLWTGGNIYMPLSAWASRLANRDLAADLGCVRLQLQIESGGSRTELIWSPNLIWSSSRSATASNSHALPYVVIESEVLASDQSGAFFFQINRQVESGALLVRPSDCPPCPHHHHPYRRRYYCSSCRPYTASSS
jgi:hypothetical protein